MDYFFGPELVARACLPRLWFMSRCQLRGEAVFEIQPGVLYAVAKMKAPVELRIRCPLDEPDPIDWDDNSQEDEFDPYEDG